MNDLTPSHSDDHGAPLRPLGQQSLPPPGDDLPPGQTPPSETPSVLRPQFMGTGGEYFGIWIINILLLVVTLGLYFPWARVRRLKFFAGNTDVGGHRLEFTGVAKQMFAGFSLALVGFVIYSLADSYSPLLSFFVIALLALVWPWLLRAALRFRMAKTAWRGLPFAFSGSTSGAYRAFAPVFVAVAIATVVRMTPLFIDFNEDSISGATASVAGVTSLLLVAAIFAVPWLHFRIKRYQHSHFCFADRQSQFTGNALAFYGAYFKTFLVMLTGLALLGAIAFLSVVTGGLIDVESVDDLGDILADSPDNAYLAMLLLAIGSFALWQAISAYFIRTLYNLVWGGTTGNGFAFAAALKFWPFFGLRSLNLILKVLTLGLYIPFAQVKIARMKLHSIAVAIDFDLESLITEANSNKVSAGADAAAELFDMDIGL